MFELVQNEAPGHRGTIYSSKIPSVTQTLNMISMDVGEDINIPIEGMMSSLSKIINDYVSEIDLSHLLLLYALLIKWRLIPIYPLFKQLNHQIISHMHHQTHIADRFESSHSLVSSYKLSHLETLIDFDLGYASALS